MQTGPAVSPFAMTILTPDRPSFNRQVRARRAVSADNRVEDNAESRKLDSVAATTLPEGTETEVGISAAPGGTALLSRIENQGSDLTMIENFR